MWLSNYWTSNYWASNFWPKQASVPIIVEPSPERTLSRAVDNRHLVRPLVGQLVKPLGERTVVRKT